MRRLIVLFIGSALFLLQGTCIAQHDHEHEHGHDDEGHEGHHEHVHHFEIGVANGLVYLKNEQEFVYGLHLHAVRAIGETHFALGVGYERLFDEHGHNTASGVISYLPIGGLVLTAAPGVAFTSAGETEFSTHFEVTYEFMLNKFHIGPMLEWALEPDDMHFTLGLHIGFGL